MTSPLGEIPSTVPELTADAITEKMVLDSVGMDNPMTSAALEAAAAEVITRLDMARRIFTREIDPATGQVIQVTEENWDSEAMTVITLRSIEESTDSFPHSLAEQQPQRFTPSQLRELVSEHLAGTQMGEMLHEAELLVGADGFLEDFVLDNLRTMFRVAERMAPEDEMKERFKKMQDALGGATHGEEN